VGTRSWLRVAPAGADRLIGPIVPIGRIGLIVGAHAQQRFAFAGPHGPGHPNWRAQLVAAKIAPNANENTEVNMVWLRMLTLDGASRRLLLAAQCLLVLLLARPALAQPTLKDVLGVKEPVEAQEKEDPSDVPEDELGRGTPRGAVEGFLNAARKHDYDRAADYLFLGRLPRGLTEKDGPRLARELKIVLDKTLWVDVSALSRKPKGKGEDGLPSSRDRVGTIKTKNGSVDILVHRVRKENGVQVWKFASATVARIPNLYDEFGYGPFAGMLPPVFFEFEIFGLQLWQAIGLPALIVLSYLAALLFAGVVAFLLRRLPFQVTRRAANLSAGPLRLIVGVLLFSGFEPHLTLPLSLRGLLVSITQALMIIAVTWIFLRLLDVLAQMLMDRMIQRGQISVTPLLPPGRRVAQILLILVAGVVMLDSFGFDVTTLLAGLGVGGIAVALAAQKSIENLFGGVTLYADRPVRVGDFCRFGDLVGTVEEIGLRSTRIRTLDRSVVSVPNAEFSNLHLDNYTRRDKFWYHPRIGLRYETTPDQLRFILVAIREMLYAHPNVDPDPARIRFTNFGAYSLDLDIFAYVKASDYGEFLGIAEDLNLRVMDIVKEAGSSFAFPSQTTYIENGDPMSPEVADTIGAKVAEWREKNSLYLPKFPDERISALKATLEFPPAGSPDGGGHAS
jgi:MscS family membrane protein